MLSKRVRFDSPLWLGNISLHILYHIFFIVSFISGHLVRLHTLAIVNNTVVSISSVQSLSHVRLFATPWIAAHQASLSITNTWSSLKLMSIELMMPSSHLILCHPLLLLPPIPPNIRVFPKKSQLFSWDGQSTGVSALASFLPKKSQGWSPLEWTGWISLQSKGL